MNVLVIDGQGGGLGRQLVAALSAQCPDIRLVAVGTNSVAAQAMHKAGAQRAATGENAVVVNCRNADIIVLSLGSQINDQIGAPLDAANMLMDNKHIGKIGDGLSLISIIDEVGNGEYWSAAGDILLFAAGKTKLSPYMTVISLGTWMYETDLMQWRLACINYSDYKKTLIKYRELQKKFESGDKSVEEKMNECHKILNSHYIEMQKNLGNLGVKF